MAAGMDRLRGVFRARRRLPAGLARPSGQVIVEFALLLPVFLLLLLMLVDAGRAFMTTHVILNAAREGARTGSLPETSMGDVTAAVTAVLASGGIAGATISASNVGASAPAGATTTVTVSYAMPTVTGTFIPGWSGNIPLTQTIRMRHE